MTIPIEVRRLLGIHPHDQVTFVVVGDTVQVQRKEGVVARTAGALRGDRSFPGGEEMRAATEMAIAAEAVRRMGK